MSKIKGIIIDDETNGRQVLSKLLSTYCSNMEIIAQCDNISDAYDAIQNLKPDFIFLDIKMPGGSGFDLLKRFSSINFEIIFITSYDKFAIQAFKYSALDYILKPIEIQELISVNDKLTNKLKLKQNYTKEKINYLFENVDALNPDKHIAMQHGDKVRFIKLSEIILIEADSNYSKFYTNSNEIFLHSKTLKYFEDLLSESNCFFRATKSQIVNTNYIKEYSKTDPCTLFFSTGQKIEISRRKKGEFLEFMDKA